MLQIPDLTDARYLREVGWFLYHEKHGPITMGNTFDEERSLFSQALLDTVLKLAGRERKWLEDKTIVSVGCGCTGDMATWPAAAKIGFDPLVQVYQKLGMLVKDAPGTPPTTYLAVGIENLPLVDNCADLAICRNSLDHMLHPEVAVQEVWRILKDDGLVYLAVDIGGEPTPDEPTIFTPESLVALLQGRFEVLAKSDKHPPYSGKRSHSVRFLAKKKPLPTPTLSKEALLQAYTEQHHDE
jgi:ubiquinone/menaquinone biosynthesis C-methylase UbiE